MAASRSARRRTVALHLAGQLGTGAGAGYQPYALDATMALLHAGLDDPVLAVRQAAAAGLGHRPHPDALPKLVREAYSSSWKMRFHVACALGRYKEPKAAEALLILLQDPDSTVRDWATFSLGTLLEGLDSPAIRDGMARQLTGADPMVRGEGLVGLALRQDERAALHLRQHLGMEEAEYEFSALAALAKAGRLPDWALLPSSWPVDAAWRCARLRERLAPSEDREP
ncbi:MAG: HEAT repeat domain-containing protein [Inhella sp.]